MSNPPQFNLNDVGVPAPPSRSYGGWIALAMLLFLFISTALYSSFAPRDPGAHAVARAEALLSRFIIMRDSADLAGKNNADTRKAIEDLRRATKSESASRTLVVIQHEVGEPADPAALKTLRESKSEKDKKFAELYQKIKFDPKLAATRAAEWRENSSSLYQLARIQALDAAGESAVAKAEAQSSRLRLFVFSGIVIAAAGLGCIVLVIFSVYDGWKRIRNGGWPLEPLTFLDSDRLALRVTALLGCYLVAGLLPGRLEDLRVPFLTLLIAGVLFLPMQGQRVDLSRFFTFQGKKLHIFGWAIGAELALIPAMLILTLISVALMNVLPPPTHPITEELTGAKSALAIAGLFFQAAIFAPVVEEIIFRGMLCPAIAKVSSPLWGIVISSLAFAMIHPQGIVGWPALAAIGAVSALLSRATNSLVPSMIMHAVHNASLLTLTLWISS